MEWHPREEVEPVVRVWVATFDWGLNGHEVLAVFDHDPDVTERAAVSPLVVPGSKVRYDVSSVDVTEVEVQP